MSFAWLGKKARAVTNESDSSESTKKSAVQRPRSNRAPPSYSDSNDDPANKFSVHITHVPFSATKEDLNDFFVRNNCVVDSIRMVRKPNSEGVVVFTGVAFADLFDNESYQTALSLHQSRLWEGSLKINIRPTLDKSRLAAVAAGRTSRVQTRKQEQAKRKLDVLQKAVEGEVGHAPAQPAKRKKKKLGKKERQRRKAQQQAKLERRKKKELETE